MAGLFWLLYDGPFMVALFNNEFRGGVGLCTEKQHVKNLFTYLVISLTLLNTFALSMRMLAGPESDWSVYFLLGEILLPCLLRLLEIIVLLVRKLLC